MTRAGVLVALAALHASCGDAYSTHVPRQKAQSSIVLLPDNMRAGEVLELHAVLFTPSPANYISDYDFGQGVEVLDFDTGAGQGCPDVVTDGIEVPDLFDPTYVFPACFTIQAQASASLGERTIAIDVESAGTPVIARARFYLLPAHP